MAKITRAHKVCDQQLHVLQERVAELEVKLAAKFISVKDAYPTKGDKVLVWFGDEPEPYMDVWKYDGENQYFRPGPRKKGHENALPHQCVTHWQPLPPDPKVQP